MMLRVENNYQLLDIGGMKFAVESFDNRTFDVSDSETGARIGSVMAIADDDLLDQVMALIASLN